MTTPGKAPVSFTSIFNSTEADYLPDYSTEPTQDGAPDKLLSFKRKQPTGISLIECYNAEEALEAFYPEQVRVINELPDSQTTILCEFSAAEGTPRSNSSDISFDKGSRPILFNEAIVAGQYGTLAPDDKAVILFSLYGVDTSTSLIFNTGFSGSDFKFSSGITVASEPASSLPITTDFTEGQNIEPDASDSPVLGVQTDVSGLMYDPAWRFTQSMFGHLGVIEVPCSDALLQIVDEGNTGICGTTNLAFADFQELWDLYADWDGEVPIVPNSLTAWQQDGGTYTRYYEYDEDEEKGLLVSMYLTVNQDVVPHAGVTFIVIVPNP